MTHQSQLENKKYRNWVKAGLGLKYTKEGLEPFCDDLVRQQHADILNKVKQKCSLSSISCGQCDINCLQPCHVRTKNRQCPLGQGNCNCQHPRGKNTCPNNVCSSVYDEIIQLHESRAPYWKNTDARLWCSEPWAVGKCFINVPGYQTKLKASEFDCSALLHVLLNNLDFFQNGISGTGLFAKVLQHRHDIVHSHSMELEDNEVTVYIDDMIAVLEDQKALLNKNESRAAVQKLRELKSEDFVITNIDESEVRKASMKAINEKEKELEQKLKDGTDKFDTKANESKSQIKQLGSEIKANLVFNKSEIESNVKQTGKEVKDDIFQTGVQLKNEIDQKGIDVKGTIAEEATRTKHKIEQKGKQIEDTVVRTGTKLKKEFDQKVVDAKKTITEEATKRMYELEQQGKEIELKSEQKMEKLLGWDTEQIYSRTQSAQLLLVHTQDEYIKWKSGFREKLVGGYKKYATKASALPLQQEKYKRNIEDVYVPQLMTVEKERDKAADKTMDDPIAMHELFRNEENPAKNIFILGEGGSGKSTFCKILIYYWCHTHSGYVAKTDESNIMKELSRYEFLFYVALRHYPDCSSIEMMLKQIHQDPNLITLLQKDSDKCLILLDGLDEWTPQRPGSSQFQASGLPAHDLNADYTIVTTSRDWKFDTLRISDSEVDKKIKLKGISEAAIIDLTEKTVETLNKIFHKNKVADDFRIVLTKSPVADVKHVPMILQQLVCLWFDDKLKGTSRCSVYSSMLDLFFEWKALKTSANLKDVLPPISKSDLRIPEFLKDYEACVDNNYSIYHLSHLALETLFDKQQDSCLTFTNSTFQALNIPDNAIACGLNVGILYEDQSACLFASRRQPSSFSFVHKSLQEYLAAVYVAIQYETMSQSSCVVPISDIDRQTEDVYQFVTKFFKSCTSVTDILKQSNVFIMLSGLEPQLLPYFSKYIYHIATSDNQMIQGRKLTKEYSPYCPLNSLQENIQACIKICINEVLSREVEFENSVYIADIVNGVYIADIVVSKFGTETSFLGRQILRLNNVLSLNVTMNSSSEGQYMQQVYSVLNYLSKCESLQSIKYDSGLNALAGTVKIEKKMIELIDKNSQTLTTVCLQYDSQRIVQSLIQNLSHLHRLTSLQIIGHIDASRIPHEYCESLCAFLEQSTQLQHIRLCVDCCKSDQHLIDLTKLRQLQNLYVRFCSFLVTRFSSDYIENCTLGTYTIDKVIQVLDSFCNACKLKDLSLTCNCMISEDTTVTDKLTRLLPSLISLNTLVLDGFFITDNIITRPSDMKHLKLIQFWNVSMSLPTWCKFLDSLPALPQAVQVKVWRMNIMDISIMGKDGNTAARQYVREKTEIFQVTKENEYRFDFVTTKANMKMK